MIFAANFKTNHTRSSTKHYLDALSQKIAAKKSEDQVYIFHKTDNGATVKL